MCFDLKTPLQQNASGSKRPPLPPFSFCLHDSSTSLLLRPVVSSRWGRRALAIPKWHRQRRSGPLLAEWISTAMHAIMIQISGRSIMWELSSMQSPSTASVCREQGLAGIGFPYTTPYSHESHVSILQGQVHMPPAVSEQRSIGNPSYKELPRLTPPAVRHPRQLLPVSPVKHHLHTPTSCTLLGRHSSSYGM